MGEASEKTGGFADKLKGGLASAAKIGAAGLAAATAAATALGKAAIENYAEYEQLTGGVETLFKESSDTVMKYAQDAYKTAGLSANQYMETVTSFSASLLQSMGGDTEAAAEKANTAITDMSDNANKMGTSMESIQNAYNGFAKQNYTMLDNLKLGYGGTKEEMQRLLDDAEKLSGQKFDLSSYGDIVDAIHVVQTEMGITGTTSKEAASTISGSIGMMKSAWQNLVTGLADGDQELAPLIDNVVESAMTVADNIIPRIKELLPRLVEGTEMLLSSFSEMLPGMITTAMEMLPQLLEAGYKVIENLVSALIDNLPQIVDTAIRIVGVLADTIMKNAPMLLSKVPVLIKNIVIALVNGIPQIVDIGKNIVSGLWDGIKSMAKWIKEKVSDFFGGIVDNVKGLLGIHSPSRVFAGIGENMALGLGQGWDSEFERIKNDINGGMHLDTGTVDFASSGLGMATAGIINNTGENSAALGNATFILQLDNGAKIASWLLSDLIKTAAANGTPIAEAQMA